VRLVLRGLYGAAAKLASVAAGVIPLSSAKAAIAMRARRGIRRRYEEWAAEHRDLARPLVWVHAPSVGEGLMARPVLSLLREKRPDLQLAYTFFSPSAEEFSRSLDVDFRDYLPFDSAGDMSAVLEALRPRALVFSKVDVWPELVRQAERRNVRLGMISAALSAGSSRRRGFASVLLRDAYALLDAVGAVDAADAQRLIELGVRPSVVEVTGDTRFDQVWLRAEGVDRGSPLLARFSSGRPTLVAGSTWPSDDARLLQAITGVRKRVSEFRVILAPHEPTPSHLAPVERWAAKHALPHARIDDPAAGEADVVLVDRVGILADLYAVADVAFVGGGFHGTGLHSVVEPAAFGAPVLFGPRHHRSRDAELLLTAGGARAVRGARDLESILVSWFEDGDTRREIGARARAVVDRGRGAADRSLKLVERLLA
jgi:3-deoxy-D-manno-octulosonic-acid transferase